MVINVPGVPNLLFKHSEDFEQGFQSRNKREAEVIVAKDGSGDFELISEALLEIKDRGGGTVWVRNGSYDEDLIIPSKTILKGDGWKTEITVRSYTGIELTNTVDVEIKDLKIIIKSNNFGDGIHIDMDGANNLTFNNVFFEVTNTNSAEGIIWTSTAGKATGVRVINCKGKNTGTGNCPRFFFAELDFCIFKGNHFKDWDFNSIDANVDNCLINSNILSTISLGSTSSNNVAIGNTLDTAVTNSGTGNQVGFNTLF